ncbi:hypothetical protein [uncultured Eubacterium sp.]|uniref:hypothetical protein n=1 Tax=uncultured Eubacterium sp. TaxID=165185 RepID=UPI0032669517
MKIKVKIKITKATKFPRPQPAEISKQQNFHTPAGRNFHKQTIGRFLKFCEHSVSSKDMSEPIGEFIF